MAQRFQAVIFDMDGTIIESALDFAAIRAELGIPSGQGILEFIEAMPPQQADRSRRRLLEIELGATRQASLLPGAAETIGAVRQAGLKTALLTRNAQPAMQMVLERFCLAFDLAWSREDGPIKPQPTGILRACRQLRVEPAQTACVGDFHYDVLAANAAGAVSILLARHGRPAYADEARHVITSLNELPAILGI